MIPNGYIEGGRDDVQINAHRITSAWSGPMIVNGNIPSCDKNVADYVISQIEDAYWVITEMVRGWYLGTYDNHGLVLKIRFQRQGIYPVHQRGKPTAKSADYLQEPEWTRRLLVLRVSRRGHERYLKCQRFLTAI